MSTEVTEKEIGLYHYFLGYARNNPDANMLLNDHHWKKLATQEIEKRNAQQLETILASIPIEELIDIASGKIDVHQLISLAIKGHP